jgi:hypothetical protein
VFDFQSAEVDPRVPIMSVVASAHWPSGEISVMLFCCEYPAFEPVLNSWNMRYMAIGPRLLNNAISNSPYQSDEPLGEVQDDPLGVPPAFVQ